MTDEELYDALDGMCAYDTGCVDSGIRDEALRARVIATLKLMPEGALRVLLARCARRYLTEEALAEGYGLADVKEFIDWLLDRMDQEI